MNTVAVECLRCCASRLVVATPRAAADAGDCSQCGYVGWAPSSVLTDSTRRTLRERPPEQRIHLYAA
jgi:hypothetical protein